MSCSGKGGHGRTPLEAFWETGSRRLGYNYEGEFPQASGVSSSCGRRGTDKDPLRPPPPAVPLLPRLYTRALGEPTSYACSTAPSDASAPHTHTRTHTGRRASPSISKTAACCPSVLSPSSVSVTRSSRAYRPLSSTPLRCACLRERQSRPSDPLDHRATSVSWATVCRS